MGEHSKPTSPMLTDNGNPELVIDSVPRLTALVEGMRGAQVSKAVEQIVQAAQTAAAKDEVARIRVKNLDPVHAERFIMRLRPKLIRKGVEVSVMPSRGMLLAGVKGA